MARCCHSPTPHIRLCALFSSRPFDRPGRRALRGAAEPQRQRRPSLESGRSVGPSARASPAE
eukprot:13283273-Alexandrium_andersonii.AAC.1